jgi:hypothetical protein
MQAQGPSASSPEKNDIPVDESLFAEFPNKPYNLQQINILLTLVDKFLNYQEEKIFKESGNNPSRDYFNNLFYERLQNASRFATNPESDEFNALASDVENALARMNIGRKHTYSHNLLWPQLLKDTFNKGVLLNPFDLRAIAALQMFSRKLIDIILNPDPIKASTPYEGAKYDFHDLDERELKNNLTSFIGQLVKSELEESAQALHNFFYICQKCLTHSEHMSPSMLGTYMAPSLISGLQLREQLFTSTESAIIDRMRYEDGLISRLIQSAVMDKLFNKPFAKEFYKNLYQPGVNNHVELFKRKANKRKPEPLNVENLQRPKVAGKAPQLIGSSEAPKVMPPAAPKPQLIKTAQLLTKSHRTLADSTNSVELTKARPQTTNFTDSIQDLGSVLEQLQLKSEDKNESDTAPFRSPRKNSLHAYILHGENEDEATIATLPDTSSTKNPSSKERKGF